MRLNSVMVSGISSSPTRTRRDALSICIAPTVIMPSGPVPDAVNVERRRCALTRAARMRESNASGLALPALWPSHQEYALLPPVDDLGQVPAFGGRVLQNLHEGLPVGDLRQGQDVGRVLPVPAWQPDRRHHPRGRVRAVVR